ncbi:Dihydroflavonol reductase [Quillaja saponaria]|uniref:Dihydroflavonol reductase n=1 Tax=Quillaja saponaria TaxID=32244 RepID=A0AAD7PNL4_QUISA|nr:Dihydroflavonol reductase [Quillaja saponaria]
MCEFLSSKYPDQFPVPTVESVKEIKGHKSPTQSSKKLLDAGFRFKYGIDEMLDEAIQCCKDKGYLSALAKQESWRNQKEKKNEVSATSARL